MTKEINNLLYGKKRLAKKYARYSKDEIEILNWALNVKVGDYIGTCMGYNVQVSSIKLDYYSIDYYYRGRCGNPYPCIKSKNGFLRSVDFTDNHGGFHSCNGYSGCALPPETPAEINKYFFNLVYNDNFQKSWCDEPGEVERWNKIRGCLSGGGSIVDDFGEMWPSFKRSENGR